MFGEEGNESGTESPETGGEGSPSSATPGQERAQERVQGRGSEAAESWGWRANAKRVQNQVKYLFVYVHRK